MKRLVAMVLVLAATSARADRGAADQLFKTASAERDPAAFAACAAAYLDLFNQDPRARDGDELLYAAGVCYQGARSLGAAVMTFKQLRSTYPNSRFGARAIRELASLDVAAARFDEAAALLEEYAKKYAGEQDAADAMREAIAYREMIGDEAAVLGDALYFERTYGAKQRGAVTALMVSLVPIYEKQGRDPALRYLRDLLKHHDADLDDTQRVVALAKLGELQWDATCKGRALCVTEVPRDKVQRCAEGVRLRVDRRAPTAEAEAALARAASLYEQRQPKDPGALHAYAMTKLRIADRGLEGYLALGFPTGLDFSPDPAKKAVREGSTRRFSMWVADRQKLGAAATRAYEEVIALHDPEAAVAASARMGQLTADFASTLHTAEIPRDVRTGDFVKDKIAAFCEKMVEVAEPLATRAGELFGVCLAKAAELGVTTPWTAVCRAGAAVIDPRVVVDEPLLPALVPAYPPPMYAPAPRPTPQDPPAYATLLAAAEAAPGCPAIADKLRPLKSDAARYLTALVAARCGREDEARRGWEALATPAALASLGSLRWTTGDGPGAIEAWERAQPQGGKLAAVHYGLALARFDDPARERDVEAGLISARVLEPDAIGPRVLLALLALRRDRVAIAEHYLLAGTATGPAIEVARAVLLAHAGRWADARAPLEAADRAHLPQAGHDLALVALHQHRYQDAADRLAGAKRSYDVLVMQGVAAGLGKPAEPALRAAIALDAARPEAHFDLGLALAEQKKFAEAAAELDLAKATALADRYRKL